MTGGRNGFLMFLKILKYFWIVSLGIIDKTTDWLYFYSETPDFDLKNLNFNNIF